MRYVFLLLGLAVLVGGFLFWDYKSDKPLSANVMEGEARIVYSRGEKVGTAACDISNAAEEFGFLTASPDCEEKDITLGFRWVLAIGFGSLALGIGIGIAGRRKA
jgi:hypothetical protein